MRVSLTLPDRKRTWITAVRSSAIAGAVLLVTAGCGNTGPAHGSSSTTNTDPTRGQVFVRTVTYASGDNAAEIWKVCDGQMLIYYTLRGASGSGVGLAVIANSPECTER